MATSILDAVDPAQSQIQQAASAAFSDAPAMGGDGADLGTDIGLPEMSHQDFMSTMGDTNGWLSKLLNGQGIQQSTAFSSKAGGLAGQIIDLAHDYLGQPYVWGGLDCSGLVQRVFNKVGINLPRISADQARAGERIPLKNLKPGDLVAWDNSTRNNGADHIAIYIGNGQIIEAPRPGGHVQISGLYDQGEAWGVRVLHGGSGRGVSAPVPANRFMTREAQGSRDANRQLGFQLAKQAGWGSNDMWYALNRLVMKESGWDNNAQNPGSTAYGIGQFLNGTWGTVGGRKTSDPRMQIQLMIQYIRQRYGNPMNALYFHLQHGWY